ncbi:hypothetical protein PISL3812_02622 [Talaromyces islandicus]|uniref:MFS-type transporter cctQ n=1 Tax=Talaromyces islandicus TaxID=28573 RepID=CCTQ_TALIS|nr:RecName: Full=MFS-type transporter cctQ; AltName: Full=Cyclochlorotine biosynthesis protein Q [Talaromyces islandicus]CRG85575.1 hypothetical protein PISL3812_02622 [Talaromyces islandicus]
MGQKETFYRNWNGGGDFLRTVFGLGGLDHTNDSPAEQRYVNSLETSSMMAENDIGSLMPLVYTTVAFFVAVVLPHGSPMSNSHSSKKAFALLNWPRVLTSRNIWSISHGIFAASMFGSFWVQSAVGTIPLFGIVGFSWAVTCRIPYYLLHDELYRSSTQRNRQGDDLTDSQGLIHGIHNFSICLAQIVVLLMINTVWILASDDDGDSFLVWFLLLGGACALLAMYFTTRLREPENIKYEEIAMEEGDYGFSE